MAIKCETFVKHQVNAWHGENVYNSFGNCRKRLPLTLCDPRAGVTLNRSPSEILPSRI